MAVELTAREISEKYNRFARWYDWVEGAADLLGVSKLRRRLLRGASGRIVKVAVGTGKNLGYYPQSCRITAVDISSEMLNVARKRAATLSINPSFLLADVTSIFINSLSDRPSLFVDAVLSVGRRE